jgi:hypothetical protein
MHLLPPVLRNSLVGITSCPMFLLQIEVVVAMLQKKESTKKNYEDKGRVDYDQPLDDPIAEKLRRQKYVSFLSSTLQPVCILCSPGAVVSLRCSEFLDQ